MSWLTAKQTKFTAYATVYTLIVLAALGLLNFLANRYNKSADLTANKRYSLAEQTEKVVRNLKSDVTVRYFDQQSRFANAKDLLDRYDNLSTHFNVVYSDPDRDPQLARSLGVREMGTVIVEANGRRETAKAVTEQEITGALIRVLKEGERKVCAVAGSGEASTQEGGRSGYSQFAALMQRNNYKLDSIRLIEKPEIPISCTIVLIGGPKFDYVPPVVNALKVFVEGGGRVLAMLDPPLAVGAEQVSANEALVDMLGGWGIKVNRDLILDTNPIGQVYGFSAAVPLVRDYSGHTIVKEMRGAATAFPLARSLDVETKEKIQGSKLFSTSEASYATTNLSSAEVKIDPAHDKKGPFAIGVAATLTADAGKQPGRVVVTGSSQWVSNGMLAFNGNQDLAMNMINWLSSDEDLISIRPREQDNRPLAMSGSAMRTLTLTSLVLIPSLILMMGIGMWWKRR